jgi:transcriptional regulator with XRE-family HTH domain
VPPRSPFGAYLESLLAACGLSGRSFARLVGVQPSFVSKVLRGSRPVPADGVEPWADALGLRGAERERFLEAAWGTRTPEYMIRLIARLRKQR